MNDDHTEDFVKTITHSEDFSDAFTVETEERAAIMEESGLDAQTAFRKAVKQTTLRYQEWLNREKPSETIDY